MPHRCPTDRLEALRNWAWARGRTDLVLLLDVHQVGWDFTGLQSHSDLACLAELMPRISVDRELTDRVRRLALSGGSPAEMACLSALIEPWLGRLCTELGECLTIAGIADTTD